MRRIMLLVAMFTLVAAACSSDDPTFSDAPIDTQPPAATADAIEADDQTSDGTSLIVSEVTIVDSPGFVVIHRDADGAPGGVVGHVAIPQGTSLEVAVPFDEPVESGDYWPMLHVDAGEAGTYEFPGADVPVTDAEDNVVMVQITLTVEGAG